MLLYTDIITDDELFSDAFPLCVGLWLISLYAHMLTFGSLQEGGWRHRLRSGLPEHHYQAWR